MFYTITIFPKLWVHPGVGEVAWSGGAPSLINFSFNSKLFREHRKIVKLLYFFNNHTYWCGYCFGQGPILLLLLLFSVFCFIFKAGGPDKEVWEPLTYYNLSVRGFFWLHGSLIITSEARLAQPLCLVLIVFWWSKSPHPRRMLFAQITVVCLSERDPPPRRGLSPATSLVV